MPQDRINEIFWRNILKISHDRRPFYLIYKLAISRVTSK